MNGDVSRAIENTSVSSSFSLVFKKGREIFEIIDEIILKTFEYYAFKNKDFIQFSN